MSYMYESIDTISDKLRWLFLGILVLSTLMVAFSLLLPPTETSASTTTDTSAPETIGMYDSPNVITSGMSVTTDQFSQSMAGTEMTLNRSGRTIATNISRSGSFIASTVQTGASNIGSGLSTGASFMAGAVVGSVSYMAHLPANIMNSAGDIAIVSAVIRPADDTPVPVIQHADTHSIAAHTDMPHVESIGHLQPLVDTSASWPVPGEITTLFGVPHWPYQAVHTGIDISDGKPSGSTPVRPFKPGRVVNTVRSYWGLGNYVIVDHGNGLTSLYAHLSSINVQVGQPVDKTAILGYQGSTGASTGPHLHFEIRVNGQVVNPLTYIGGRP